MPDASGAELRPADVRDRRIERVVPLLAPETLLEDLPLGPEQADLVVAGRDGVKAVLDRADERLLAVVGPCSVHDPDATLEYAGKLGVLAARLGSELLIAMRVYFEKPRTTIGWKGLINDPDLDGSYKINQGLRLARQLLLDIAELGLPAGCEYLDMITPQYVADLVSWGAIGARTTESQVHRELASGLSCPVGFKNGTDGNVRIALDAIKAASQPHHFLSVTKGGHSAIVSTNGNEDCHVILRGGRTPNYDAASVEAGCQAMAKAGLAQRVMVDLSHANAAKKAENQLPVGRDVANQVAGGDVRIVGVMVESHLVAGRQDLVAGKPLTYGQSITDACLGWEDSVALLDVLAGAVRERRVVRSRHEGNGEEDA